MEQATDRFGLRQLVVKRHRMLGRQYVRRNLTFLQIIQRLTRNVKALGHSTGEHNDSSAIIEQFLYIGYLNTGSVTCLCLAPIPFARATGEKLCIFVRLVFALGLESAPRDLSDPWRTIAAVHNCCHSERGEESRIKFEGNLAPEMDQRCFASLNMTTC